MEESVIVEIKVTPINKDNWQDKVTKLKIKYPSIEGIEMEFKENKIEEFIDKIYLKIGKTTSKTKEEFYKFINSL